jgi:hypothetical protein
VLQNDFQLLPLFGAVLSANLNKIFIKINKAVIVVGRLRRSLPLQVGLSLANGHQILIIYCNPWCLSVKKS